MIRTTHSWSSWVGGCMLAVGLLHFARAEVPPVSTGLWVKSDGSQTQMACPSRDKYGKKALKLPSGCLVQAPGVWISVDRHRALVGEAAAQEARLKGTREAIKGLRDTLDSERLATASYFQETSSKLDSIAGRISGEAFHWRSAGIGLATGVAMCGGVFVGGALD
jgi:hypothetical protein